MIIETDDGGTYNTRRGEYRPPVPTVTQEHTFVLPDGRHLGVVVTWDQRSGLVTVETHAKDLGDGEDLTLLQGYFPPQSWP